ncbi:MAG TPA: prolyl oligopeptidase family serine peptidase [Acidimicrobiales bacterium]|nr:prolyl oligopeptidase family serine peptidase [Acidimicrobiales bacterium]
MGDTFPRQQARTRRFTLGAPRTFTVSPDGRRVVFLRSAGGEDPLTALWALDLDGRRERQVVHPRELDAASPFTGEETSEERARRERRRETASGIVSYATDGALRRACFAVGGRLWLADLDAGGARPVPTAGPVFDPRLDPAGGAVAYCSGRSLRLVAAAGGSDRELAGEDDPAITWGQAEFVAAEEMDRTRGFWWAPDGASVVAARVDVSPVDTWWISDPAHPGRAPVAHRYPAAGTADAVVTLHRLDLDGTRHPLEWDRDAFPYLVDVAWPDGCPPRLVVKSRDHRRLVVVASEDGTVLGEISDPFWVDRVPGVPAWLADGRLVWTGVADNTVRLVVDGRPVTPAGLQVRRVVAAGAGVLFEASENPVQTGLWRWGPGGLEALAGGGVVSATAGGEVVAVTAHRLDGPPAFYLHLPGGERVPIASHAAEPLVSPAVHLLEAGERRLRVGVLLPTGHRRGRRLPVVMCPYGGPGAQMVVSARRAWLEAQWLADQGFGVVVADGRGTPGRGPAWEREVAGDLATVVLQDQVDALGEAAARFPDLDVTGGVGIRGWSFGGYLAALAVLRRPDVFAVAVAGAPVTDWLLYDTFYTERFLGHPRTSPQSYQRSSLIEDAPRLSRPLMLIHGLADDNVVVAHTLRLSQALMEAGRPHTVLPLTGVTHMASQEEVAEHLLELQVEFLARHLKGDDRGQTGGPPA